MMRLFDGSDDKEQPVHFATELKKTRDQYFPQYDWSTTWVQNKKKKNLGKDLVIFIK